VQVRVRATAYDAGWAKANECYQALVEPIEMAAPDVRILGWVPRSDILYIGRDDQDRPIFTLNFETLRDGA
jgi:hypothetical protein